MDLQERGFNMIKMNWIITDDLSRISIKEFENEWNGIISGYFELNINQSKEGFCPQRDLQKGEEGNEDVLFWLSHLKEAIGNLKEGKDYEMILLTMNRYKIYMRYDDSVNFYFINRNSNIVKWHEKISMQEFEIELSKNINAFYQVLKENNIELLESKWIMRLRE